ncbi:hypothetical protein HED22_08580 [Thalassospira sp. HF15]|uniref:hypothetical protein n=1 Tax=Thalassospira sp. HF15 TaxID=2722755 RepID=UPI0014315007|nr:hypothetical protein [Thalassospira sp. HF15]NIY75696.1 hypothetical protein [Thalassospira sp. HF15]
MFDPNMVTSQQTANAGMDAYVGAHAAAKTAAENVAAPQINTEQMSKVQRAIADQVDLSAKANEKLEEETEQPFAHLPVFEVQTNALDVLSAVKPAIQDAQGRMNNDAFIILSMMGVPPEKARQMASDMADGPLGDVAISGVDGVPDSISVESLVSGIASGDIRADAGSLQMISQAVNIDLTQIQGRSSGRMDGAISVSEIKAKIEFVSIEIRRIYQQDPLILDLDGNGIDVTDVANGTQFDIDGDGDQDQTAWVSGGDALLALDRNGDGKINDGTELFGDQNGAKDGFAELAKYDDNQDGVIDENDAVFSSLVLLRADGSQTDLASEGIKSISLTMITPLDERLVGGDLVAKSGFTRADGSQGMVGEVLFDVEA